MHMRLHVILHPRRLVATVCIDNLQHALSWNKSGNIRYYYITILSCWIISTLQRKKLWRDVTKNVGRLGQSNGPQTGFTFFPSSVKMILWFFLILKTDCCRVIELAWSKPLYADVYRGAFQNDMLLKDLANPPACFIEWGRQLKKS